MYKKRFDEMTDWEQHILTSVHGANTLNEVIDRADNHHFTVKVEVNGVEIPFDHFMETLERNWEHAYTSKAMGIVEERLRDIMEPLEEAIGDAERKVRDSLGLEKDSWDD